MYKTISSKQNEKIKKLNKLMKQTKYREQQNLFVVEGFRLCKEAVNNGIKIYQLFFTLDLFNKYKEEAENIFKLCDEIYMIDNDMMQYLSDTKSPQGMICVCEKPLRNTKLLGKILVLEKIQDPGNMGTILRSAKAFCIDTIVLTKGCCDPYSMKALRSCMGGIFDINMIVDIELNELICKLDNLQYNTYAAVVDKGATKIHDINFSEKTAVFIGNEGNGLCEKTVSLCKHKFTIPMNKNSESLNAAVAAGIIIWEMSK